MQDKYILYARKSSESEERQALSVDSQVRELTALASRGGLDVVATITEAQSAKTPGRPEFARMMQLLNEGRANAILCWKLDRLARNPVDGGAVIWALDTGVISKIATPSRTFKKSGDDAFWMSLEFGMAKKYVDDLSDNVKRGLRTRAESGQPPIAKAPPGYLIDRATKRVVPDPKRFELVRRVWQEVLRGHERPREILEHANSEWGLTTARLGKSGGNSLCKSSFYLMLKNPFYAGEFVFGGKRYKGGYRPMITMEEFERVQEMLLRERRRPATSREFVYRGILQCGACNRYTTAETKVNRYGSRYTYYHCAREVPWWVPCREPSIEERSVDAQLGEYLNRFGLAPDFVRWVERELRSLDGEELDFLKAHREAVTKKLAGIERKIDNLTHLRLSDRLDDVQFARLRESLLAERAAAEREQRAAQNSDGTVEPFVNAISFSKNARERFQSGEPEEKRVVVRELLSNLFVESKKLRILPKKQYELIAALPASPSRLALRDLLRIWAADDLVGGSDD